ncbi:MAG: CusA/CzcA family heavy metal efflux RND transporter [Bacteroidetes bacterium]|nr:CusA/CzcA family heavy metal efflux RND transporter [Bacteroidota bacterium]
MIDSIIGFSVRNRLVVLFGVLLLTAFGLYGFSKLPLDAVPDITTNQVQVITVSPNLSPEEMEQFVTTPLELELQNLQYVVNIRSTSRLGLSVVTIVFEDDFDLYHARQLVQECLNRADEDIPDIYGRPAMLPITTGLGEVYQYTLQVASSHTGQYSLQDLRMLQDWVVRRQLAGIPGIVEISSFGGQLKRWEIAVNPVLLQQHDLSLQAVMDAVARQNESSGASYIQQDDKALFIRGSGLFQKQEDIEAVVVALRNGNPVRVADIATVAWGTTPRMGALTRNGEGEVVGGIALMQKGGDAYAITRRVEERMAQIQSRLPAGVQIVPYLERSDLIGRAMSTVRKNLLEGGLIVVGVLVLLLGNLRAGLIVASAIPLALLFALGCMHLMGVSANLMSLGAIDFGLIVDGAVIVIEGILFRLHGKHAGQRLSPAQMQLAVTSAAKQVRQSASFGEIIILIVYLPILALQSIEGKMFKPMALTVSFAIIGGLILSMTYIPMMAGWVLSRKVSARATFADKLVARLQRAYLPLLKMALRYKGKVLGLAIGLLAASLYLFMQMGANFIPKLEEGDIAIQASMAPGTSLERMVQTTTRLEQQLRTSFPEVRGVVSKIGTSEVPTDPMGPYEADIMVLLHPKDQWRFTHIQEELADSMKAALRVPGVSLEFQQPISLRFNELITGAKADIAVMIYGENLTELARLGKEAATYIRKVPGAADVKVESVEGLSQLRIHYNRPAMAALGLNIHDLNVQVRAAFAGESVGTFYEGERRMDIVVRLQADYRLQVQDLRNMPIALPAGGYVPLAQVAAVSIADGPALIARENTRRRLIIGINVRDRDMERVVLDIQAQLNQHLRLPVGYSISYGGEFANLQAARTRLGIAVPAALLLILILLYFTLQNMRLALLVFTAIPLSAIGGILALWLRGMPFSISAAVGFIALFGVSVLNGIVLISYLQRMQAAGMRQVNRRILYGALERLRPVLMTASVAALGFLPMALSTDAGAEVQKPLATVVIGGLVSSTLLTLIVLPVLYGMPRLRFYTRSPAAICVLLLGTVSASAVQAQSLQPGPVIQVEEALQRALTLHPTMQAAQARERSAAAATGSAPFMQPLQLGYSYGQLDGHDKDHNINVMMPLPAWASWRAQVAVLEAQAGQARAHAEQTYRQVRLAVHMHYHTAVYARALSQLRAQQTQQLTQLLAIARLRVHTGDANPLDTLHLTTRLMQAQWQQQQAQQALMDARLQLQQWVGTDAPPMPADSLWLQLPALPDSLYAADDPTSHPDYAVAAARLHQVQAEQRHIRAQLRPQLALGYFYQTLARVPNFQGIQLALTLPTSMRAQRHQVQAQQHQIDAATQDVEAVQRKLQSTYQRLYSQAAYLQQQVLQLQQYSLPQAQQLVAASMLNLQVGELSMTECLLMQEKALSQHLQVLDVQWQYLQTLFQIDYLK